MRWEIAEIPGPGCEDSGLGRQLAALVRELCGTRCGYLIVLAI
jgi:hypothetical protein